jgi:hypothetical protein
LHTFGAYAGLLSGKLDCHQLVGSDTEVRRLVGDRTEAIELRLKLADDAPYRETEAGRGNDPTDIGNPERGETGDALTKALNYPLRSFGSLFELTRRRGEVRIDRGNDRHLWCPEKR